MRVAHQRLLGDSLVAAAAATPEKTAVIATDGTATYAELYDQAARFAAGLRELGVSRADRVALCMDNSLACAVALWGTVLAGGVFMVVNPQTKADKLAYLLEDSDAAVLVTEGSLVRLVAEATAGQHGLKAVVAASPPADAEGIVTLEEVVSRSEPSLHDRRSIPLDLAALIYTSGSTGRPKGVMMTHAAMVFAAGSISEYLRLSSEDRILGLPPLAFDYGLYQLLMSVRLGATLVLERSFAFPAQTVRRVQEEQVTVFPGVPTVYATLVAMNEREPFSLPSVRRVTNTAAALLPALHDGIRAIFPDALLFAMYGLTECKRVSYLEPELLHVKPSSVGRPIPGTEALVLRPDGTPVSPGEVGVLYVRGQHVMAGYWNQPELTADMLVDGPLPGERMLCTHDQFTVDEDGFLYFVGRTDDIIKTRGEKVSPAEVENALVSLPGVREAAVVGVPDEVLGEAIHAFVTVDDATLAEKDLIAGCRLRLEAFMVPQAVTFLDELPKTDTGKVRKRDLVLR